MNLYGGRLPICIDEMISLRTNVFVQLGDASQNFLRSEGGEFWGALLGCTSDLARRFVNRRSI